MESTRRLSITNAQLCIAMRDSGIPFTDIPQQLKNLNSFVLRQLGVNHTDTVSELTYKLNTFLSHVIKRYRKSHRNFDVFMKSTNNLNFLSNPFPLPSTLLDRPEEDVKEKTEAKRQKVGHDVGCQTLPFGEDSVRGQQQLASGLVTEQNEPGAVALAASGELI